MAIFDYTARIANGEMKKGSITAQSKAAAITALQSKQLNPIFVKEISKNKGFNMNINIGGHVKERQLVVFTREFATMVNAGVPILRSLNILKEQAESPVLKKALEEVILDVQGGANLSDALKKHPKVFSNIYVNMVKAGEAGGILDQVLNRLASQMEKDAAIKSKIKSAMVYPAVIFSATLIAFFILMTFIVPKIGAILKSLSGPNAQLPIYTRIMLSISHIMKQPSFLFFIIVVVPVALILFKRYIKTPKGRYKWHSFLLKLPVIKVIITKTAVARFSRIFASLMSAGVNIVEAIDTTAGAIGNAVIEKELLDSSKALQSGSQLSTELQKSKHFPPIVPQMLEVGEETGKTDTVIIKIAEFYEEDVDSAIGALSSVLEPIMIILLGSVVAIIAISVFGPITKAETSVHG